MHINSKRTLRKLILSMGLVTSVAVQGQFQEECVRVGVLYQDWGMDGIRTRSSGVSFSIEFAGTSRTTWDFGIDLMNRRESQDELVGNVRAYDQVLRMAPGFRRYLRSPLQGPYVGATTGVGVTKNNGMSVDMLGRFGYAYRKGGFTLDLNAQLGVGNYSFSNEIYSNGTVVDVERFSLWGVLLRPGLTAGFCY